MPPRRRSADPERHRDPERERLEGLVARLRGRPARFAGVAALAAESGLGAAKLHAAFRRCYHSTPARMLGEARIAAARRLLLATGRPSAAIAADVGFASLLAFNAAFRAANGMSPLDYRRLLGAREVRMELPRAFPRRRLLAYLGRERDSLSVLVHGDSFAAGIRLGSTPALLRGRLGERSAQLAIEAPQHLPPTAAAEALALARRMLGLGRGPADFERHAARNPRLAPLLAVRRGLRIPLVADPFDGLVWVIVGQQISLPFAFALRRALLERVGEPVGAGLCAPARAAAVAELTERDLTAAKYSRGKAEYLLGVARRVTAGELKMEELAEASVPAAEAALLAVRGLGPWSVQYLLMRVLGFEDCVPLGDAGLARGLTRLFALPSPPGPREMAALMEPFAPYRSWGTYYLWQSLEKET
jgi:AraC family transcriptional regulator of adaptative response / DNA-3-methyladenine glycosylase II